MRKFLLIALVMGLIAGNMGAPAVAAKKKKKKAAPVAVTFWLAHESDDCADDAARVLKLTEATEGSNCGNLGYGAPYPVTNGAALSLPMTFMTVEGVPLVLDASQPITGTIMVSSRSVAAGVPAFLGAGQATTKGVLTGTTSEGAQELGTFESTYAVTPAAGVYEVAFEIQPPAELDKVTFTSLDISLHTEGAVVNHGYFRTLDPASSFTVPTWQ